MNSAPTPDSKEDIQRITEEATAWVVKLNARTLSREETFAFESWLEESISHQRVFGELSTLWSETGDMFDSGLTGTRDAMSLTGIFRAWAQLYPFKAWSSMASAAVLLLFLSGLAGSVLLNNQPEFMDEMHLLTAVGEHKSVSLSDGSVVQLNTDTQLQVSYRTQERRILLVQGEAHFDVAKNPSRPFRVYAGQGVIEAVGTAFSVQLNIHSTEVIVTEGKVKLTHMPVADPTQHEPEEPSETIALVEAGRNAVFGQTLISVEEIGQNQVDKELAWQKGMLIFDGDTLESAVQEFKRYTTTDMVILDDDIRSMRIIGFFNAGDTDRFIHTLQASFQIAAKAAEDGTLYLYREP